MNITATPGRPSNSFCTPGRFDHYRAKRPAASWEEGEHDLTVSNSACPLRIGAREFVVRYLFRREADRHHVAFFSSLSCTTARLSPKLTSANADPFPANGFRSSFSFSAVSRAVSQARSSACRFVIPTLTVAPFSRFKVTWSPFLDTNSARKLRFPSLLRHERISAGDESTRQKKRTMIRMAVLMVPLSAAAAAGFGSAERGRGGPAGLGRRSRSAGDPER